MWVGLLSILMLFGGLTSAYIVRQAEGQWLFFELPQMFYVSTVMIVLSSVTLFPAIRFAKSGNNKGLQISLIATLILGVLFSYFQFQAWGEMVDQGIYFGGTRSNAAGSYIYAISGIHLLHLIGGLVALLFTSIKALLNRYTPESFLGVELAAIYWHFLDFLWIYLLLFLMYIR